MDTQPKPIYYLGTDNRRLDCVTHPFPLPINDCALNCCAPPIFAFTTSQATYDSGRTFPTFWLDSPLVSRARRKLIRKLINLGCNTFRLHTQEVPFATFDSTRGSSLTFRTNLCHPGRRGDYTALVACVALHNGKVDKIFSN